ncbi:MAG TPA: Uma2 family endonuclease [Blastocatellia bacterium]|nr:Uma2 family endonuclease [Blastocatellia bacterium]
MKQISSEEGLYTVAEYLTSERAAELKHEYFSGEVVAMAGATREHILITGNIARRLGNQLEGKPCETYSNDMRVRATPTTYVYPGVVVVCGDPQFEDSESDILLNPTVVIEVLSKSTEARDRGEKFSDYRANKNVREIIFVSRPRVEQYVRQANDEWIFHEVIDPAGLITLASIECTLSLAEIYERVHLTDRRC